jgi:hypothetical protein
MAFTGGSVIMSAFPPKERHKLWLPLAALSRIAWVGRLHSASTTVMPLMSIGTEAGPLLGALQRVEIEREMIKWVGSRSAPIGIP